MKELKKKGVELTSEISDRGYGLVTLFKMPGDFKVEIYQPKYERKNRKPNSINSVLTEIT